MEKRVVFGHPVLPFLLVAPQIAITLIFFMWPASQALYQSVLREDAFGLSTQFVWVENFSELFRDPQYLHSLQVTIRASCLGEVLWVEETPGLRYE